MRLRPAGRRWFAWKSCIRFPLHILDRAIARIVFLAHRYTLYLHQNSKTCCICYNTMYFLDQLLQFRSCSVVYLANRAQVIFEAIVRAKKINRILSVYVAVILTARIDRSDSGRACGQY
jgi:hypothetical protein